MATYSVYGLKMATEFTVHSHLRAVPGAADLCFECSTEAPVLPEGAAERLAAGASQWVRGYFYLNRFPSVDVVSLPKVCDWYFWPDRIVCHLHIPFLERRMEIFLLGTGLSYFLERSGIPTLHASAVEIDGGAVAFLGSNRGGKSTLAVSLMQEGHPLITDDILPIEQSGGSFHGRTGYPQLRLWPEQAERLLESCEGLEFVCPGVEKYRVPVGKRFGHFADGPKELRCIYLPERREDVGGRAGGVEIDPLAPREALKELHAKSFSPLLAEDASPGGSRLLFWGAMMRRVHIRRLSYPNGIRHLPMIRAAIRADLIRLRDFEPPGPTHRDGART